MVSMYGAYGNSNWMGFTLVRKGVPSMQSASWLVSGGGGVDTDIRNLTHTVLRRDCFSDSTARATSPVEWSNFTFMLMLPF